MFEKILEAEPSDSWLTCKKLPKLSNFVQNKVWQSQFAFFQLV